MRLDWERVCTELQVCVDQMAMYGLQVEHYEVGPETYSLMQAAVLARNSPDAADQLNQAFAENRLVVSFGGVMCKPVAGLPEYKLWPPLESSVFATVRRLKADQQETV